MPKPQFTSQKLAKLAIQQAIDSNDRAVYKALLIIYNQQTDSEKAIDSTTDHNAVGFSAFDAEILSSFAKQVQERRSLSIRQLAVARPKIRRYWRQLATLSGALPH